MKKTKIFSRKRAMQNSCKIVRSLVHIIEKLDCIIRISSNIKKQVFAIIEVKIMKRLYKIIKGLQKTVQKN